MSGIRGFMIAAPQSGSGKTTVTLAIMAALARRKVAVAPFKCGPDFIDPGYHRAVTGNTSINLDSWMCSADSVRCSLTRQMSSLSEDAIAVIEGAMGLFDGIDAATDIGSSAAVAAAVGAPVLLVVNVRGMAASVAALVSGFAGFDPRVKLAGVIFNNVGSHSHAALLKRVMQSHLPDIPCIGSILRDESLVIPSRHLGLVTAEDNPLTPLFIARLADAAEEHLDMDALLRLKLADITTRSTYPVSGREDLSHGNTHPVKRVGIAVARDAAFCFVYEENLRLLSEAGAELLFFSPLNDTSLPEGTSGIYLPGGYPELYAEVLHENTGMRQALKMAISEGMPVYAECGGFVYLTEGLDREGCKSADFVGIFPVRSRMLASRKALGYRQVELLSDCIIGRKGDLLKGHEFHYSETEEMPQFMERCYRVTKLGIDIGLEGYSRYNCIASYIHLHFGSCPTLAVRFVDSCRASRL